MMEELRLAIREFASEMYSEAVKRLNLILVHNSVHDVFITRACTILVKTLLHIIQLGYPLLDYKGLDNSIDILDEEVSYQCVMFLDNEIDKNDEKTLAAVLALKGYWLLWARDRATDAVQCLSRASDLGNIHASYQLAACLFSGNGDTTVAACLGYKAAKAGHAEAFTSLGLLYYHGTGVQEDKKIAAHLLFTAAISGSSNAKLYLARLLSKAYPSPLQQDVRRAYALWSTTTNIVNIVSMSGFFGSSFKAI